MLADECVVEEVYLPNGKTVNRSPVGVQVLEFGGSVITGAKVREWERQ